MDVRNVCLDYDNVKLRIHGKGNKERCVIVDSKTSALIQQYMGEFHGKKQGCSVYLYRDRRKTEIYDCA